jgi:NTP pyrophosphatase (non-canonical NTP hydrolase)
MNIKETMTRAYEINKKNGFWETPVAVGVRLMLVVSELSEALEADRKVEYMMTLRPEAKKEMIEMEDDRFKNIFGRVVKDKFEDELADAVIRLFDMAEGMGIDLPFHIDAKLRYNSLRPYKHGGKAY